MKNERILTLMLIILTIVTFSISFYVFIERNNGTLEYMVKTEAGITEQAPENKLTDLMITSAYYSSLLCILSGIGTIVLIIKSVMLKFQKLEKKAHNKSFH
jgi:hypothetical protein